MRYKFRYIALLITFLQADFEPSKDFLIKQIIYLNNQEAKLVEANNFIKTTIYLFGKEGTSSILHKELRKVRKELEEIFRCKEYYEGLLRES